MKQYTVDVYTGDKSFCGTNANVYLTIFGDKGDTGERELSHSETHRDKFERKQVDRFQVESADLGAVYKVKIRHDNSGISPDWFLSRVEVIDGIKNYVFYCENWLAKGKGDSKLERTLYEKVEFIHQAFSNHPLIVFVFLQRIIKVRRVVLVLYLVRLVVQKLV